MSQMSGGFKPGDLVRLTHVVEGYVDYIEENGDVVIRYAGDPRLKEKARIRTKPKIDKLELLESSELGLLNIGGIVQTCDPKHPVTSFIRMSEDFWQQPGLDATFSIGFVAASIHGIRCVFINTEKLYG